ncbi:MAG: DinB family protein [Bacteroidota bacterium]
MHPTLQPYLSVLESQLESLTAYLVNYSEEQLNAKPSPEAWSVLDIIQHMMIAEKGSMAYVKKKTSYPESLKEAGISNRWRKFRLNFFLQVPIKVKAPTEVATDKFKKNVTLDSLLAEWRTNRKDLTEFLEQAPDDWINKLTYKHAFAGRLTFDGMLLFFRDHFVRHRKQIDRTLAKVAN